MGKQVFSDAKKKKKIGLYNLSQSTGFCKTDGLPQVPVGQRSGILTLVMLNKLRCHAHF